MNKKLISIVIPAYNEQDNISELTSRLQAVFGTNSNYDFEAIIVENGSQDNTYEKLLLAHQTDKRFKILQLARNFRMDGGITAGLNFASGDAAVIMTADLQDPPELITQFIQKWEEGYENIYGIVTKRNGTGIIRRFNSQLFYRVANALTDGKIPSNVSDFRLIDKKVYQTINSIHERNRFVRGLFAWVGYKSVGIKHERAERFAGVSGAHTFKVIDLAIKGIFAHSYIPLKLITFMGISVSMLSFALLVVTIIKALVWGVPFAGYGTIMTVVLLMFGILFTILGVMSEYIGLIYEEVKQRPNFIVKNQVGLN
ncbi:glycosyltransferase family 2 protein [Methylotenera sp. 73s]|nr:glycosyltransferase family 2 protein [Methylotenera sp. 73s]